MSKQRRSDVAPPFDDASSMMEGSFDDSEQQEISKSALKREMTRLQKLGEDLLTFKLSELAKLPITELLLEALTTAARIKHREGKRRQLQYVGKLMRREKPESIEAIEQLLEKRHNAKKIANQQLHRAEEWRDKLLADDRNIETFIDEYPNADRQHLRQLTRQHKTEVKNEKPPASARKLFSYIREHIQTTSET